MKLNIFVIMILMIFAFSCSDSDIKYLQEQNQILESQFQDKLDVIYILYQRSNWNYGDLYEFSEVLKQSYELVRNDYENNMNEIEKIVSVINKNKGNEDKIEIEYAVHHDEISEIQVKNKLLLYINETLFGETILYLTKRYDFISIEPFVELNKNEYKIGDLVKATIFVKAKESSNNPKERTVIYTVHDGLVIDTFNNKGDALYIKQVTEKGKFKVKGHMYFLESGLDAELDSIDFKFEYEVK